MGSISFNGEWGLVGYYKNFGLFFQSKEDDENATPRSSMLYQTDDDDDDDVSEHIDGEETVGEEESVAEDV